MPNPDPAEMTDLQWGHTIEGELDTARAALESVAAAASAFVMGDIGSASFYSRVVEALDEVPGV